MTITLLQGDCREMLQTLPEKSIQTVVTSPPYYGLRKYSDDPREIGQEATPAAYVAALVEVFRQVRRVLRDDGTVWLNLGDSYSASASGNHETQKDRAGIEGNFRVPSWEQRSERWNGTSTDKVKASGLASKQLLGIPWRVAFALQDDGWYLRSDIIWHKPNCMPESVADRPTRAHEYLFLLAKGQTVTRVVKLADLPSERIHFRYNFRLDPSYSGGSLIAVLLATAILDFAQEEQQISLSPFDPQIGQERAGNNGSTVISDLPIVHRAALFAARFLGSHTTTKQFMCELDSLGITLSDSDQFLIAGGAIKFPLPPGINRDGKATVAVHHAGKVCKFDIFHKAIISQSHTGCRYYYDAAAIAEPIKQSSIDRINQPSFDEQTGGPKDYGATGVNTSRSMRKTLENFKQSADSGTRNRRTVWSIATQPYSGAHYATMPEALIAPCILAGSSAQACEHCGAAWVRVVEPTGHVNAREPAHQPGNTATKVDSTGWAPTTRSTDHFAPSCACPDNTGSAASVVLDPFAGSGTVSRVATQYGRNSIGIELNQEYIEEHIEKRTNGVQASMIGLF